MKQQAQDPAVLPTDWSIAKRVSISPNSLAQNCDAPIHMKGTNAETTKKPTTNPVLDPNLADEFSKRVREHIGKFEDAEKNGGGFFIVLQDFGW